MIPLTNFFDSAEISIVGDNARTHARPTSPEEEPRRTVKRSSSCPMDLYVCGGGRRRRRHARRGSSDSNVPPSRWSAEPSSPPRVKKESISQRQVEEKNRVLRNVVLLKPVRQSSLEDVNEKSSGKLPEIRGAALMPMMPVRQKSLRDLVGCKPASSKATHADTVKLITQALQQLDSLTGVGDEMDTASEGYRVQSLTSVSV